MTSIWMPEASWPRDVAELTALEKLMVDARRRARRRDTDAARDRAEDLDGKIKRLRALRNEVSEPRPVRWADLDDVASAATVMTWEVMACRDFRHSWRPWAIDKYEDGGIDRTVRCGTCGTRRIEELDGDRRRIGRPRYVYPDGYALNIGRFDDEALAVLRKHSEERFIAEAKKVNKGVVA